MIKLAFQRKCPDCGMAFEVDNTYSDEAYTLHLNGDPSAVCGPCFNNFDGLTIDQIIDPCFPDKPAEQQPPSDFLPKET